MLLALSFTSPVIPRNPGSDTLVGLSGMNAGIGAVQAWIDLAGRLVDSLPDSALQYANQAELMLMKDDPDGQLPGVFTLKGEIYNALTMTARSINYYRKAYDEYIKMEAYQETGNCARELGNIYYEMADFSEAYYYYMHSLQAYEAAGDREGIASMQNNLGIVAHEMGKLQEAEKHYTLAFEYYRENGTPTDQCRSLNNIGLILYDRQLFDSSLVYFNQAAGIMEQDSLQSETEQYILSAVYNNMALAYSDLGEYQLALHCLLKGLELARGINDPYNIGSVYINLGAVYGDLQVEDSALYYLHRALKIGREMGYRHLEMETYDELAKLHAGTGRYASAYNWQLRYDTLYKELFNENQSEQIARLRAMYEQELKDHEIEQLHSESEVQRLLNKVFIGFIVIIMVLVIIIAVNLRAKKKTNMELKERNQQISSAITRLSESEKELQRLNTSKDRIFSVVAHDLRNPVAAVTGFSELLYDNFDEFPAETQKEYLLQILQGTRRVQNMLENLLVWARSQMKVIKYEPGVIRIKRIVDECVKELKANLEHKKVKCQVKVDRKCEVFADRSMIHIVFHNLIMNAIKFSFPGGKIWITSRNDPGHCTVLVSDEGIGIEPEIQEKLFTSEEVVSTPGTTGESGSGLGLVICKDFLDRNKGRIEVSSEPGNGTSFIVSLPSAGEP